MCVPQRKKVSAKPKRMPAWLMSGGREDLKGKEGSFCKCKSFPNEENKKEHRLWQNKCKMVIRKAKKDFEECMASNIKGNKKNFLYMLEAGNLPEKQLTL